MGVFTSHATDHPRENVLAAGIGDDARETRRFPRNVCVLAPGKYLPIVARVRPQTMQPRHAILVILDRPKRRSREAVIEKSTTVREPAWICVLRTTDALWQNLAAGHRENVNHGILGAGGRKSVDDVAAVRGCAPPIQRDVLPALLGQGGINEQPLFALNSRAHVQLEVICTQRALLVEN